MASSYDAFLTELGSRNRVLLIGGLAVIAHGLSRPTKDADVWLDPFDGAERWADCLLGVMKDFPSAWLCRLPDQGELAPGRLAEVVAADRVIRVRGLSIDIDVFREPNQLRVEQFDEVWNESVQWSETVRVANPLDLIITKLETGRDQDMTDIHFLEHKVRASFGPQLETATPAQAQALLDRFADHVVLSHALKNPDPEVRHLALRMLEEFAASGDPFAIDILKEREGAE